MVAMTKAPRGLIDPNKYTFTFGKYKGLNFREVWKRDPTYIHWAVNADALLGLPHKPAHGTHFHSRFSKIADIEFIEYCLKRPGTPSPTKWPLEKDNEKSALDRALGQVNQQMDAMENIRLADEAKRNLDQLNNFDWVRF